MAYLMPPLGQESKLPAVPCFTNDTHCFSLYWFYLILKMRVCSVCCCVSILSIYLLFFRHTYVYINAIYIYIKCQRMDICTVDILKSYLSRKVSVISKQSLYFIYYVDSKKKQNKTKSHKKKKKKCLNYSRTFWGGGGGGVGGTVRAGSSILNSQTTLYGSCLLCLSAAISVCFFFWKMMCIVTFTLLGECS